MRTVLRKFSTNVVLGIVGLLVFPLVGAAATDLGAISGKVRDSSGTPVAGALVLVVSVSPIIPERTAITDKWGAFDVSNLFPGAYSVKVSMPRFLPAFKEGIRLNAGGSAVLTVNLQNALDVVRRAVSRDRAKAEDITWTLRSSRSTQPILRLVDEPLEKSEAGPHPLTDYSGYLQLYSRSVGTSAGTTEGVGSQFSVTMPLDPTSQFTFAGQYTEVPSQPRGFGATYEFVPAERHRAALGINMRQTALLADPLQSGNLREVQISYGEDFQWSDHFVFNYGTEVGRAETASYSTYLRPRFGISWVPRSRTTLSVGLSSQAPAAADDAIRGKEYFDRTLYVPPALERYSHAEASLNHVFSENLEVSAAVFRDRTDAEALFINGPGNRPGVLIFSSRQTPAEGVRLHVNRRFRNFEAGALYTAASGIGLDDAAPALDDIRNRFVKRQFHIVSARFKADVDTTQTEITAIYRWISNTPVSRIDPYQRFMEYNDPTLSVSVAQNLPTWRLFPGKVQAILDARNLLEHAFGAERSQVSQYPLLLKGGISIKF